MEPPASVPIWSGPKQAAPAAPAQQVATNAPTANKDAIDVEAKAKH
jgi:hypothetical protein